MSTSSPTDISVKLGSNSFVIYECELFDLKVKCADVEGVNMYHVKSFSDAYNAANEKPIVEFKEFLKYEGISEYLLESHKIHRGRISTAVKSEEIIPTDSCRHWNIPSVIVYCYSKNDGSRGYWVRGEVLSRYAQYGCARFAVIVDMLVTAVATQDIENIKIAKELLTVQNDQFEKKSAEVYRETNRYTNYLKPDVGKDYVAYVEWDSLRNKIFIGSLIKSKFLKEKSKHDEDGNPVRYFIYATENKFGAQLRDIFKDVLVDTFRGTVNIRNNHLMFKEKTELKDIEWQIRNRLQKVRRDFTILEI